MSETQTDNRKRTKKGKKHCASCLYFFLKNGLECVGCQNQYQEAEDSVELGEYGQYHGCTESIVTCTDGADTVSTNLSLTDSREQGNQTQCQTYTEDSTGRTHSDVGSNLTVQHEETDESVQTLRRGKCGKTHVRTAGGGILLESADGGISADSYTVSTTDTRKGNTKGYAQIS